MGFKLRSGNNPDFKSMGSSPSPKAKAAPYNQGTQEMTDERWSEMSDKTKSTTGLSMNDLVRERDKAKKAGGNWQKYQNKINEAYGVEKRHEGAADKTKDRIGGGTKSTTTVGAETVTTKTNKDGSKTKTTTENLEGKGVQKTKDGEVTKDKFKEGKGGAANNDSDDTGNEDTKAAADDKKSGNRKADKQFKKYQKHQERQANLEEKGKGDSKRATRQGKKADEAYEKYVEAGGDKSRV